MTADRTYADGDTLAPGTPELLALRRRVLLAGVLTFALFLSVAYVLTALDLSGVWLLPALALLYVAVVRPLLRPVREAVALRRRLARRAWQDGAR